MNSFNNKSYVVADIGGTNARFAIYTPTEHGKIDHRDHARFRCAEFDGLSAALDAYLEQTGHRPDGACFSIAAPVDSDQVQMTNLNWSFSISALKKLHNLKELWFINDATAVALATTRVDADQLEIIKPGTIDTAAARINLIPGTGFGVGAIMPNNGGWVAIQGEGGHATMAAVTDEEFEVLKHISAQYGRAIADRVLSGPGMLNLYQGLAVVRGLEPLEIDAPEMTRKALAREDSLSVDALDLYCTLLGRLAGDLALTLNAHGGVYLSGSLMQRIGSGRIQPCFNEEFTNKGLMSDKIGRIQVMLMRREYPGLLGASVWLESQLERESQTAS